MQQKSLQLTTSIIEKKYCNSNQLRLTLRLNYANLGTQPLILYKYSTVVFQSLVSVNVEDAIAKRYKQEMHFLVNFIGDLQQPDKTRPGSDFVVLESKRVYIAKTHVIIFIDTSKAVDSHNLPVGEYVLQIKTHTWYETEKTAKRLNKQWKSIGSLWTDDITSMPMPFNIERQYQTTDCSQ
jgi:hypothetical protein